LIRKYNNEDLKTIIHWFDERGMNIEPDMIPKVGFIDPEVAAGFLIQTDTSYCILEPFIANPNSDPYTRDQVLKDILYRLELEAFRLGYKGMFGFSTSKNMVDRAKERGFKRLTMATTVFKDISE
jgi:hypothetical protein